MLHVEAAGHESEQIKGGFILAKIHYLRTVSSKNPVKIIRVLVYSFGKKYQKAVLYIVSSTRKRYLYICQCQCFLYLLYYLKYN